MELLNFEETGDENEEEANKIEIPKSPLPPREESDEEKELLEEYTPLNAVPTVTASPCRTTLYARYRRGPQVKLKVYADVGAAASFISKAGLKKLGSDIPILPSSNTFHGAVKGKASGTVNIAMKPKGAQPYISVTVHVLDEWTEEMQKSYGDMILGIPAYIDMNLVHEPKKEKDILHYKGFGVTHHVQKNGKISKCISSIPEQRCQWRLEVASVGKHTEADGVETKTVHPTDEQWKTKLAHLDEETQGKFLPILQEYREQFFVSGYLPPVKGVEYKFKYEGGPFREPPLPMPKEDRIMVMKQMREQEKFGVVKEVTEDKHKLEYVSNTFLKQEEGKKRLCVNYVKMNAGTKRVEFPLPNKEDMIAKFSGGDHYITMDAKAAYNQIPVAEECRKYMVFSVVDEEGKPRYFMPLRTNFGSMNVPGFYQRFTGDLFTAKNRGVYIDDLSIKGFDAKLDDTVKSFRETLEIAKKHNVTFAFKKTYIVVPQYQFLGEILDKDGHRANPDRIRAMKEFPMPRTRKHLRRFLGIYNFLSPHKRHATTGPITQLQHFTSKDVKFNKAAMKKPFEAVKEQLCKWLLLYPFDPEKLTYVMSDSSDTGLGGVLLQEHGGRLRAIAVHSKRWPRRQKQYPAHVKEGMAIVGTLKRFQYMLKQTKVKLLTDSQNARDLLTTMKYGDIPSLWLRWRSYINSNFHATIVHVPERVNLVADVFSRQTVDESGKPISPIWTDPGGPVLAAWHEEDVFQMPLMRMVYDAQQKDEAILTVIQLVKEQEKANLPPPKTMPKAVYVIDNGLLKRKHFRYGLQTVVPRDLIPQVLYLEHDPVFKGHPGISTMKVAVRQSWYWKGMDEDIENYVGSCLGCQLAKAKISKRHARHGHRMVSNIFNMFSMDLVDMSTISKTYRYLLVLQDYYSGFTILTNLRNKKASGVTKALWDALSLFGPPQALLTDNGKEFINSTIQNLVDLEQIQHVTTFPYRAQGNAKNERSHQVIRQALRTFTAKQPQKWHLYTKKLQYMMNSRPNAHSGVSPYEVLFALKPRPLHNTTPFLEYDHEKMREARLNIKQVVDDIQLYKSHRAAANPPPTPLTVGQKVIVVRGPSPNAVNPGQGPYIVTSLIGHTGANLKHTISGDTLRAPRKWLRPLLERKEGRDMDVQETPSTFPTEAEELQDEEEIEEKELEEQEETSQEASEKKEETSTEPKRKKRRLLDRLKAHNEPTRREFVKVKPEIGHIALIKQGTAIRPGEILEDQGENWKLQWYGTSTNKEFPRRRWKWYPGWEKESGDISYQRTQVGAGKPAECVVPKSDVLLTFPKLTMHSAFPSEVVEQLHDFKL